MQNTRILVLTSHEAIRAILLRLINQRDEWQALGAESCETVYQMIKQEKFDLLLLGSGFSEVEEQEVENAFLAKNPKGLAVKHYGGGSGLLYNEIQAAIGQKQTI